MLTEPPGTTGWDASRSGTTKVETNASLKELVRIAGRTSEIEDRTVMEVLVISSLAFGDYPTWETETVEQMTG